MATTFFTRTDKARGAVSLFVRVQDPKNGLNIKKRTPIKVDLEEWNNARKSTKAREDYRKRKRELWKKLDEITNELNALVIHKGGDITKDDVEAVVDNIYYYEQREKMREEEKRKAQISFMDYYADLLKRMTEGRAFIGDTTRRYTAGTIRRYRLGYNRLREYERVKGIKLNWDGLTAKFFDDYAQFLQNLESNAEARNAEISRNQQPENYSNSTIAIRKGEIKQIMMRYAREFGNSIDVSGVRNAASFTISKKDEPTAIYLTKEDVEKIKAVDLSGKAKGFTYARDLFLVGIHTAQRISDYNHITRDNIKERTVVRVNGDTEARETRLVIELVQQKTKKRVFIPVNTELRAILEKYDYQLPSLADQVLNRHLKDICKEAGLDEPIEVRSTKGGKETTSFVPKWQLCHSHTARRTGATWMHLSGMDSIDIMRITGHSTPEMLERYIKASALEVSDKLADKYDIFK